MADSIQRIKSSYIDGRAKNPRYVQNQLRALHEELTKNASKLCEAIAKDSGHSPVEVDLEYCQAVDCVKAEYLSIDVEKRLEEEYMLARGKDSPDHRESAGIVYIVPTNFTLLFSVVSSLASAIAGGNCVVLQLGKTLSATNDILRKILTDALDRDTFAIVDSRPADEAFFKSCIEVDQVGTTTLATAHNLLQSTPSARVIAIVDRTANIEQAAKSLVRARLGFAGKSPYAPDLILVNEFRVKEFSNAVLQECTKYLAEQVNGYGAGQLPHRIRAQETLKKIKEEDGCMTLLSGKRGNVVHVTKREAAILQHKINEPLILFHLITSLDDAIDLANSSSNPLLATYIFAAPSSAKYVAQFINASISIVNHIPVTLLVGPAAPMHQPPSPTRRYDQTMFTVPRPSFIQLSEKIQSLENTLDSALTSNGSTATRNEMLEQALAPLPPTGQPSGKAIGFFEQGLITGTVVLVLPVVGSIIGLGSWALWKGIKQIKFR